MTTLAQVGLGLALDAYLDGAALREGPAVRGDDLAALLYTSGSTGEPKGVMLSHENIGSFVRWATTTFAISPADRLVSHAPFHFDLSTYDLFATFAVGASVFIPTDTNVKFPAVMSQILARERISVLYAVPSALHLLTERGGLERRDLSALRLVLFAGEGFPVPNLRRLMARLPHAEFVNLYGPTETNVCTYHRLPGPPASEEVAIPIGIPCGHCEVTIRDASGVPVGIGEISEICVAGPAVMRGYWGDAEATARARLDGCDRSYRTGDYGVWRADGTAHFLGRRDSQVKVRGHRVELLEVENVLRMHPGVAEATVVVAAAGGPEAHLVAFVVPRDPTDASPAAVARHCAQHLPAYAAPSRVMVRRSLPHTSTGKIDRQRLEKEATGFTA